MNVHSDGYTRDTFSFCPKCGKTLKAFIVELKGKIFLVKKCDTHGQFKLKISCHAWYYKDLNNYYFKVMPSRMKQKRFYIYMSNRCNLNCPICLLEPNQNKMEDIDLNAFEKIIRAYPRFRYYLYGAEPTLHDDLPDWILLLKRYGNLVNIHTNGIKLGDYSYLKKLKESGLGYVSLQFDGFDDEIYLRLRNQKLLDLKLKALDNLEKLNIPTGLNVTIAKGVNETQVGRIIDYAVKKPFLRDVSFATVSFLGDAEKNFSPEDLLMPDDLIDIAVRETKGKISRRNIYLFQKLYYTVLSIFNIRRCYNFHHIALVRGNQGYQTFDELFSLADFEKEFSRFSQQVNKNRMLASGYFFLKFIMHILRNPARKIQALPFNMLLPGKKRNIRIPQKILLLSFGTVCDKYKYDSAVSRYCGQGFVYNQDGKPVLSDSISNTLL